MSITTAITKLDGTQETRAIQFENGGDSETLYYYNERAERIERYWIRTIAFPNRVALFYIIDESGDEQSPVMLEHAMNCVVDARNARLAEHLATVKTFNTANR